MLVYSHHLQVIQAIADAGRFAIDDRQRIGGSIKIP
jgi:hypothetical protein